MYKQTQNERLTFAPNLNRPRVARPSRDLTKNMNVARASAKLMRSRFLKQPEGHRGGGKAWIQFDYSEVGIFEADHK